MLLVKTFLKESKVHGIGCFSAQLIKKGDSIWLFNETIDQKISFTQYLRLPQLNKDFLKIYAYRIDENLERYMILCGDHARHMNHSEDYNVEQSKVNDYLNIAYRDIQIGEELTCNYFEFDKNSHEKGII